MARAFRLASLLIAALTACDGSRIDFNEDALRAYLARRHPEALAYELDGLVAVVRVLCEQDDATTLVALARDFDSNRSEADLRERLEVACGDEVPDFTR